MDSYWTLDFPIFEMDSARTVRPGRCFPLGFPFCRSFCVYKELTPMRKDQVDLANAVVWIPESKTPNGVAEPH